MKNFKIKSLLFSLLTMLMITITTTSCEKTETISDPLNAEEGYLSTTNNAEEMEDIDLAKVQKPVFQKSFSGDMTKEEADAEWGKVVKEYMEALPKMEDIEDRSTKSFYTLIKTFTGTATNAETTGTVYAATNFKSNRGYISSNWIKLDHSGNDRRRGTWDFYLIKNTHSSSLNWVQLYSANIALRGTDAWRLKYYDTLILPDYQPVTATGSSSLLSNAYIWLDSDFPTALDFYYTGRVGTGRVSF